MIDEKPGNTDDSCTPPPVTMSQPLDNFGLDYWTPVPANEIDTRPTGYVLGTHDTNGSHIGVLTVTRKPNGDPIVRAATRPLDVPSYARPENAQQPGTPSMIDTNDGR